MFFHPVWPYVLYEFVKAKDRRVWLQERERHVDFVLHGVAAGTMGWQFLDDAVA